MKTIRQYKKRITGLKKYIAKLQRHVAILAERIKIECPLTLDEIKLIVGQLEAAKSSLCLQIEYTKKQDQKIKELENGKTKEAVHNTEQSIS